MARASHAFFIYEPLQNPANEVRLLKQVQPHSNIHDVRDEHICCELSTRAITDKPKYIAISYTWGDAASPQTITVNGASLSVSQNCWYVPWQARLHGISDYLWVDAICINQKDEEEKSQQVSMMGSIYSNASQVHMCLGPHQDYSSTVFHVAHRHAHRFDALLQQAKDSGRLNEILKPIEANGQVELGVAESCKVISREMFSRRVRAQLSWKLEATNFFKSVSREDLVTLVEALYVLSERSYFKRLWIIQEILLGQSVVVFCGESSILFQDLLDFESDLSSYCSSQRTNDFHDVDFATSECFSGIQSVWHSWTGEGMGLLSLIDYFAEFKCSEARDRIYGVLAMVDWQGYAPLVPDYGKSMIEIALQAISYMCPLLDDEADAKTRNDLHKIHNNQSWPIASTQRAAVALT